MARTRPPQAEPVAAVEDDIGSTTPVNPEFRQSVIRLAKAGNQLVIIPSYEDERVYGTLATITEDLGESTISKKPWYSTVWHPTQGFAWLGENRGPRLTRPALAAPEALVSQQPSKRDPVQAFRAMDSRTAKLIPAEALPRCMMIFTDLHYFLMSDPNVLAALRISLWEGRFCHDDCKRPLWMIVPPHLMGGQGSALGGGAQLPPELVHMAYVLDFPLPSEPEIRKIVTFLMGTPDTPAYKPCSADLRDRIAASALGLPGKPIEDAIAEGVATHLGFTEHILDDVERRKAARLGQQGYLIYTPSAQLPATADIGGFEGAAEFVRMQAQAYKSDAAELRLDKPRGALLLGIPGTGKTLFAKTIAQILYEETGHTFMEYFLNVPALFGSLVGETEARFASVIKTLRTSGRYVLLIDEMEKLLGGASRGGGDSGVSLCANAQILTWLAERVHDPMDLGYVVGTMNSTAGIAPEFFRRFDATFYTSLPDPAVRREILAIHLRKRGVDLDAIPLRYPQLVPEGPSPSMGEGEWAQLVAATADFIGSELEDVVIQAKQATARSYRQATPAFAELMEAAQQRRQSIVARTHSEEIRATIKRCEEVARPVTRTVLAGPTAIRLSRGGE